MTVTLPVKVWKGLKFEKNAKPASRAKQILGLSKDDTAKILDVDESEAGDDRVKVQVGIYHSVAEFGEKAKDLKHPFDGYGCLKDDLRRVVFQLLTRGPEETRKRRAAL